MSAVTGTRNSQTVVTSGLLLSLVTGALLLPSTASADQFLEIHNASLTTYVPSAKSNIQDLRPQVEQRGVNLDGTLRAGSTHAMALAGNPAGSLWRGSQTLSGVRLDTGAFVINDIDMSFPAAVPWVVGRTYNGLQKTSGGSHYASSGFQGKNWSSDLAPELVWHDDDGNSGTEEAADMVYLLYGADRYIEFRRGDDTGTGDSSDTFQAVNGAAGAIVITTDAEGPDLATYYDQNGNRMVFFWLDDVEDTPAAKQFALWKKIDTAGNVAYIGHATNASTALSGYTAGGAPKTLFDSTGRKFTCTYSSGMLTQVKAEVNSGGWVEVGKVDYSYYVNADAYGEDDDLKLVTVTMPLSSSGDDKVSDKYYRYYDGTYHATNNPGYHHQIQYIINFENARNFDWGEGGNEDPPAFDDGFLTASEGDLKPYTSANFKYDTNHKVVSAYSGGACGCSGAANGTHTFEYETNTQYSDGAGYDSAETEWKMRATVKQPDVEYEVTDPQTLITTYVTQYFDEAAQAMHQVRTDGDPDGSPSLWAMKVVRDSNGQVEKIHSPANVTAYTHTIGGSWGFTTSTTAGLVRTFTRIGSGNDLEGFVEDSKHKEGTSGSAYLDRTVEYDSATKAVGDFTIIRPVIDASWVYSEETTTEASAGSGPSGAYETTFTYTFYTGDAALMPKQVTQTNPTVTTANNGSNASTTRKTYLRKGGSTAFVEAEDGIYTYTQFTDGQLTKRIDDVKTNGTFDTGEEPSNWGFATSGDGVDKQTIFTYDAQGRSDLVTQPDGRVLKTYYSKLADGRLATLRYNDYEDLTTDKFYGPVSYSVTNHAGKTECAGTIALRSDENSGEYTTRAITTHIVETRSDPITAIALTPTDSSRIGNLSLRVSANVYDETGTVVEESRAYFNIPDSGDGTEGTHYDATYFGYDDRGRRVRTKTPDGTIARTDYDAMNRRVSQRIGTNDNNFNGGSSGTDNMVKVQANEYDSGNDKGNSYLTKRTAYVQDSDTDKRDTTFSHDVRGRTLLTTNPTAPHLFSKYDNMGRVIASGRFSSTASIVVGTDDPTTETANRLSLSQMFYDQRGQVWKSQRHEIDLADGSDDNTLLTLTTCDAAGRTIKVDGTKFTKIQYDRLGRQTHQFRLASDNDTAYADADDVAGDIVLQEFQTTYESTDSDDVVMTAYIYRFHDDRAAGETTTALDTNADGDDLKYTATNLEGRIHLTVHWRSRSGKVTETVRYGTNGGSDFDRDGLTVPARSDTALLTERVYNTDGTLKSITDPRNLETQFEYDDLGRQVTVIGNYVNGTPSGNNGDDDVYTRYVFTDGLRTKVFVDLDADNVEDADDQVTIYTYGTTKGVSAGDSKIETGHLLQKVQYSDSSGGADVVTFAYNAKSQQIWTKDQAGNVIQTNYNDSGRTEHKRITTLDADFDGAVRRISTTYDSLGRVDLVTQYDNAVVGSGSVVNEAGFNFDGWGNVSKFEQDHNSTVATGGSLLYDVDYTYAKATTGRNTIRRTGMTLPDGNVITYSYQSTGNRHDDEVSRVTGVKDGPVVLASYDYNGVGQVVGTDYPEIDFMSNRFGTTSGSYDDFDEFDRPTSFEWTKDLATDVNFSDFDITYDRNGNITLVEDNVHGGFDVDYTMDNLDRLQKAEEGTWNGSSITSRSRQQIWEDASNNPSLDQVGNWDFAKLDLNGDGDFTDAGEYLDDRTHNDGNELTARDTDDNGTPDFTLVYDEVGNLTDDGEHWEHEYDAFGRLRKITDTSDQSLIAEYEYNGLGHRVCTHQDTDLDGDTDSADLKYYFAYDERWRIVATFRGTDSSPKEQFVHHNAGASGHGGRSYIDAVIMRDKDANTAWTSASDGTLEERIYYCQNWRNDVVLTVDSGGDIVEHARYSSYGVAFGIPAGDTNSDGDCDKGDSADTDQIQTWIDTSTYAVLGDLDCDGDTDSTDKTKALNNAGTDLGWGDLSHSSVDIRRGYAGYELDSALEGAYRIYHVRKRVFNADLGLFSRRDPLGDIDGPNLYQYVASNPLRYVDPTGTDVGGVRPIGVCPEDLDNDKDVDRLDIGGGCRCYVWLCCYPVTPPIQFRGRNIPPQNHCFVKITCNDGSQPTVCGSGSSGWGGRGPGDVVPDCTEQLPPDHIWGSINCYCGPYAPGNTEYDHEQAKPGSTTCTLISSMSCDEVQAMRDCLSDACQVVDDCCVPYWPLGSNSNSTARFLLESCVPSDILLPNPANAPGWDVDLNCPPDEG